TRTRHRSSPFARAHTTRRCSLGPTGFAQRPRTDPRAIVEIVKTLRAYLQPYFQDFAKALRENQERLEPHEIEQRATAAYLRGRDAESAELWSDAHRQFLGVADYEGAARCAFWLAFQLFNAGEASRGNGWIVRAQRALDQHSVDSVIRGHLLIPRAVRCI